MSDRDVDRELKENRRRDHERERAQEDDGPIIDTAEAVMNPLTRALHNADDDDGEVAEERREENDAEQRPGH